MPGQGWGSAEKRDAVLGQDLIGDVQKWEMLCQDRTGDVQNGLRDAVPGQAPARAAVQLWGSHWAGLAPGSQGAPLWSPPAQAPSWSTP